MVTANKLQPIESTAVVVKPELDVPDVVAQVKKIQGVMNAVMHKGEHYGVIPNTQKPTLLQPGAQKLCLTFRLDPQDEVIQSTETDDLISFTVRTTLYHIPTGERIASGIGSCNSKEKRYASRSAWDLHNTILKMASKRALVAAVLRGTAASDIFTQDVEDLPVEYLADHKEQATPRPPQRQQSALQRQAPQPIEGQATLANPDDLPFEDNGTDPFITDEEWSAVKVAAEKAKLTPEQIRAHFKNTYQVGNRKEIRQRQANAAIDRWTAAAE